MKISQDFFKKRQVAITKITDIQLFSKAIWANLIGRHIWKGRFKVYNIFKNGGPMQTLNVSWQIFQVWSKP